MNFALSEQDSKLAQSTFISKVYAWMCMALMITAVTAAVTASTPELIQAVVLNRIAFYILMFGELGLVMYLSARISSMSAMTATVLFILYSVLNGLTLSVIFMVYTASSISTTFLATSATFGVMSIYGYTTKRDLTSWGNLLFMALIGIVIGSLINLFLKNEFLLSVIRFQQKISNLLYAIHN